MRFLSRAERPGYIIERNILDTSIDGHRCANVYRNQTPEDELRCSVVNFGDRAVVRDAILVSCSVYVALRTTRIELDSDTPESSGNGLLIGCSFSKIQD